MSNARRIRTFSIAYILAALFLTACSIAATLNLYNNTDKQVEVFINGIQHSVPPRAILEIEEVYVNGLAVKIGDNEYHYNFPTFLPALSVEYKGWWPYSKRLIRAQLETDGSVWALSKDQNFPVTKFGAQPDGFPIKPNSP